MRLMTSVNLHFWRVPPPSLCTAHTVLLTLVCRFIIGLAGALLVLLTTAAQALPRCLAGQTTTLVHARLQLAAGPGQAHTGCTDPL